MKFKLNSPKHFDSANPGQEACRSIDEFLEQLAEVAPEDYSHAMGYPGTNNQNMNGFYDWYVPTGMSHVFLNNAGDPFSEQPFKMSTLGVERKVIEFLAPFYGINVDNVWGIVTTGGTDGNNHGIYFGAQKLRKETGLAPIVYVSKESHYSNMRLCDLQNLEVRLVDCDIMGRMRPESLREALDPKRPALIIYSMGSTFKGAIDDQRLLNDVVDEVEPIAVHRHVDAALFGGYLPFTDKRYLVDINAMGFQSIAISGHKFFGIDMPCGLFITTKSTLEYQKAYNVGYLKGEMPMINCSRSAMAPMKFLWVIKNVGREGLERQARQILERADYLLNRLTDIGWKAWKNEHSNTVFFRHAGDEIVRRYSLAGGYDEALGGALNHAVVMQQISKELIDELIEDIRRTM